MLFFFSYFFSQIYENLTDGFRRDKLEKLLYATRATREYQNHGISPDFHMK